MNRLGILRQKQEKRNKFSSSVNLKVFNWRMPSGTGAVANGAQQNYSFTYDALNRLRNCHYSEGSTGSLTNEGNYDESIGSYDLNGNILSLSRKKAGVERDALTYSYEGNRLMAVNDAADDNTLFTEKSQSGIEYTYDVNGNMITDLNKGVSVAYNVLNLPKQVESGSDFASYIYDASGNKLAQMIRSGSARDTLYYSGAFVYNDTKLDYALTGEGRVLYTNGLFSYEYFLKDHLGSTRMATAANGTVNTSTFYYPFGLALKEVNSQGDNRYLYNGKELQNVSLGGVELGWVDYGARMYDPQLGRWHIIDNKVEKYYSWSPYVYAINDPVKFIDVDGNDIYIYYPTTDQNGQATRASFRFDGSNGSTAPDNAFVQSVIKAYNYDVNNGGGDNLKEAATNHKIAINVLSASEYGEDASYDNAGNVYWNQDEAFQSENGLNESPASVLEHEFTHGVDDAKDHKAHMFRRSQYDAQYGNKEERRVITGSELETEIKNGEYKPGQVANSHGGKFYKVNDPTSTTSSAQSAKSRLNSMINKEKESIRDYKSLINSWLKQNPNIKVTYQ